MFGGSYSKEPEYKVVQPGRYACLLDNVTMEKTKGNTDYLLFTFIIQGGEFDKSKLFHKLWMTEKAYNMTAQQLDNIYVFKSIPTSNSIEEFMEKTANLCFALCGKKFEVEVQKLSEWEGKQYPQTFLTHYLDEPVSSVQKVSGEISGAAQDLGFNDKEEIAF